MQSLRSLWLRVHRWLALGVGWLLAIVGLAGAVLVVAQPLDRWAHPELFRARTVAGPHAPPQALLEAPRQRLDAEFAGQASFTFRPPRDGEESLWVLVRGPWNGTVYLDPSTGQEQGRRGETEGFVNVLFKFHSSLALQETGKAVLACIALSYLFLLVTGLVLWWPRRWPPSWRIEWRRGSQRALIDLHRLGGAVLGLMIAVSVATGAYMAWRPLGAFVSTLAGAEASKPPTLPKLAGPGRPPMPLDALVATAQSLFPNALVGYVQVPAQPNRPLRVRMRLADDPHPNGLTSVWIDPRTGAVVGVHRWNELDPGARAVSVIYPLHTGVLGGPVLEAIIFVNGIALGGLGITGLWLWWRRRAGRTQSRQARSA
ncbi:PepSY domain-containing protein [Variovorax paradoxus]|nr:PepSY domain-containing protein [Variovorax paradoxus]